MKTKFSTVIMPVLLMVLALTSAFGTANSSKEQADFVTQPFELHSELAIPCVMKNQSCSLTVSGTFCRVSQNPANPRLWEKDEDGNCTIALYKP